MGLLDLISKHLSKYDVKQSYSEFALKYLTHYRYVKENSTSSDLETAIASFQSTFGIHEDGELGPQTLKAMTVHRCGCPDKEHVEVLQGRLGQANWGIYVKGYLSSLSKDDQLAVYRKAFTNLSAVCGVTFSFVNSESTADLVIDVGRGSKFDFDGPGGVLGWCEIAVRQSHQQKLMLDDEESWIILANKRGIYLLNVVTHEICHGLGLTHSSTPNQLMNPYYSESIAVPQSEDIKRLVDIYGRPLSTPTPTPTPPPTPIPGPSPVPGMKSITITLTGDISSLRADGWFTRKN